MQTEIEATFLGVDHSLLREKLSALGAVLVKPEQLYRRTLFDHNDMRLDKKAAWIRLRDEGEQVTLAYKQRNSETIDGMTEIEVTVSDYEKTAELLRASGLTVKAEQETKRELWEIDRVQIMLDTWPWLEPIVEIEGENESAVKSLSDQLGFDWNTAVFDTADKLYQMVYDVTRYEISSVPLTFGPVPEWLERKRRK